MKLAPAEMSRPVKYADLTFAAAFALAEPPGEGVKVREEDPEKAGEALVRQLGLVAFGDAEAASTRAHRTSPIRTGGAAEAVLESSASA